MKNIYSNIYKPNLTNLKKAKKYIENNNAIGIPTETVYGLGADATNDQAVTQIFKAKGRPHFNPLIVHVRDEEQAARYARWSSAAQTAGPSQSGAL